MLEGLLKKCFTFLTNEKLTAIYITVFLDYLHTPVPYMSSKHEKLSINSIRICCFIILISTPASRNKTLEITLKNKIKELVVCIEIIHNM